MKRIVTATVTLLFLFSAAFYFLNGNLTKNTDGQDSIEADFSFSYQVLEARGKNITTFASPDNYLTEFNRPRIPLYSKEIELPENASLERVELKDSQMKTYENVEADFIPTDIHFVPANDTVKGFYPEQVFWHNIFEMLDGRKKIEIIAAPLQYNNETKQTKVYSSMKIAVYIKP